MGPNLNSGSAYKSGGVTPTGSEVFTELFMKWCEEKQITFRDEEECRKIANAYLAGYTLAKVLNLSDCDSGNDHKHREYLSRADRPRSEHQAPAPGRVDSHSPARYALG